MCRVYISHILRMREKWIGWSREEPVCFFIKYFPCSGAQDDSSWIILLKWFHVVLNHQSVEVFFSVNSWPKWTWPTGCWAETASHSTLKCSIPPLLRPSGQWRGFARGRSCVAAPGESRDVRNTAGDGLVQFKQAFQVYSAAPLDGSDRCHVCIGWYLCVQLCDICKMLFSGFIFLLTPNTSAHVPKKQF